MSSHSEMAEDMDCSRFFMCSTSLNSGALKVIASEVEQWKLVEFEKTPLGCPVPKEGEVWDPVIGAGPFRPWMGPKGVAVADGVLLMMRLYFELPSKTSGITLADLQKIHGFTQRGKIQRQAAKTPGDNGSTVYDVDGNLITIDEAVMRGNNPSDATRYPGRVNETNFLKQKGPDHNLWFNRLFNGADTQCPAYGAIFAQQWLANCGYDISTPDGHPVLVRRTGATGQEQYKQYYLEALARREKLRESTSLAKPSPAPSIKLRLNIKKTQNLNPQPLEAPADLTEPSKEISTDVSEDGIPSAQMLRNVFPCEEVSARVRNSPVIVLGEPDGDKCNKDTNEGVASALTKTFSELEFGKALSVLETSAPAPLNNIVETPAETSAEKAARVRLELASRKKELEEITRELKEIEEKAATEKAAAEEEAAAKAAAEKAAMEKEAAEKAAAKLAKENDELNRKMATKSLKHMAASIKHSISAYLAQRKAEVSDKEVVGKLDEELVFYFWDALNSTASEPQKRKFKEEEEDDGQRPAKIAKK